MYNVIVNICIYTEYMNLLNIPYTCNFTCLHSSDEYIKMKRRTKKNIEVITPTENHVSAKFFFLFSQYQIINDDTAKS